MTLHRWSLLLLLSAHHPRLLRRQLPTRRQQIREEWRFDYRQGNCPVFPLFHLLRCQFAVVGQFEEVRPVERWFPALLSLRILILHQYYRLLLLNDAQCFLIAVFWKNEQIYIYII